MYVCVYMYVGMTMNVKKQGADAYSASLQSNSSCCPELFRGLIRSSSHYPHLPLHRISQLLLEFSNNCTVVYCGSSS